MSSGSSFRTLILKTMIITSLNIFLFSTHAEAGCGWTSRWKCSTDNNVHGATIDNMGPPYDVTDASYKRDFLQPAWFCWGKPVCCDGSSSNCCWYHFVIEYEWQPDPNNPCCGSSDPCCGSSDPCCGSSDPCCGKENDPCCIDPVCCGEDPDCCPEK